MQVKAVGFSLNRHTHTSLSLSLSPPLICIYALPYFLPFIFFSFQQSKILSYLQSHGHICPIILLNELLSSSSVRCPRVHSVCSCTDSICQEEWRDGGRGDRGQADLRGPSRAELTSRRQLCLCQQTCTPLSSHLISREQASANCYL